MRLTKPHYWTVVASMSWLGFGQSVIVEGVAQTDFPLIILGLVNIVAAIAAYMDACLFKWPLVAAIAYTCLFLVFDHPTSSSMVLAVSNVALGYFVFRNSTDAVSENESTVEHLRYPADLFRLLCLLLVPAFLFRILTLDKTSGLWLHFGMASCFGAICEQLRADNARNAIRGQIDGRIFAKAILAWAPVCLLLLPGILITITLETLLGRTIEYVELKSFQIHTLTRDQLSSMVASFEVREYRWWWPPDLVQEQIDGWNLALLRSGETAHKGSGFLLRGVFAFVHTCVRGMQITSVAILVFVISRSFLHVLFRVWLRQGGQISFRLAYKARDVAVATDSDRPSFDSQS